MTLIQKIKEAITAFKDYDKRHIHHFHEDVVRVVGEVPQKATQGAAGYDLVANETTEIKSGQSVLVKTGISCAIPPGYVGLICSRSGLALKSGIHVLQDPGILDSDYRGDVGVILHNACIDKKKEAFKVNKGDRIAQLLIVKLAELPLTHAENLNTTERGNGGFGSTGKN